MCCRGNPKCREPNLACLDTGDISLGYIYLYTGDGAGKTTNALGLALRSIGHGNKVVIVQFLKGRKDVGEVKIGEKLGPEYEIRQFGTEEFVDPKHLRPIDYEEAKKGLEYTRSVLMKKPDLLVLDEINLVLAGGLLGIEDVLDLLKNLPSETDVVLTGRLAPRELIDRADFVNVIVDVKHPPKMVTRKGIQY
jgi:cob(I)alamin adenosyltransferase